MERWAQSRRRPGEVRDAIFDFLDTAGGEAELPEIQEAVARRFQGELSESSVRSYLRLNTPSVFARTSRGRYRLKDGAGTEGPSLFAAPVASAPLAKVLEPVFASGKCALYQADCIEWLRARADQSIHAIVTDPPYGLVEYTEAQQEKLRNGRGGVWRVPPSFDGHKRSPLPRFTVLDEGDLRKLKEFFFRWARECLRVLTPGAHVLIASNPLLAFRVAAALSEAGLEARGEVIRLVMTMRGGDRPKNAHEEFADVTVMPRSMFEPWLLFRKPLVGRVQDNLRTWKTGALRRPSAERPFGDVIKSHPTHKNERKIAPHPSLKPQSFLRTIVRAILPLGEGIVLDPFAGSGSTLAAAEALNYESIGVERDPAYVELAQKAIPRLQRLQVSRE